MTGGGPAPPHHDAVAAFCALYAEGRYFDAHEALEVVWRRRPDPLMAGLQGLIQWAVAFEHRRRGNAHGARVLLARAWSRLAEADDALLGVDLGPVRAAHPELAREVAAWDAGGPASTRPAPPIRPR